MLWLLFNSFTDVLFSSAVRSFKSGKLLFGLLLLLCAIASFLLANFFSRGAEKRVHRKSSAIDFNKFLEKDKCLITTQKLSISKKSQLGTFCG